jgi:hypothetical protein
MDEPRSTDEKTPNPTDLAILQLLLTPDIQRPWSGHELALEIGSELEVADSLARLRGAGLIHRCNEFVWASRAALEAERLIA